ncbi:hypothetical protein SLEP1_g54020 [Rubroshorea leprosula]|uniref:Uncharacterized protein n=1 Tax=Rubroshorea leprosula TaxID=152421 RepID=A0AAV5MER5_9ROSI|nr:hypothetical protein SLEP1_g54020 [Rubroshorea leprosula]
MEGPLGVRKGAWTEEEDDLLKRCIQRYGEGRWHQVPVKAGLNRCRKSCRLRWLNYLKPNIKRGKFEDDEVDLIIRLHKLLGNRWTLIAGRLPGRTANDVKNYWNSHIRKTVGYCTKKGHKDDQKTAQIKVIKPKPWTLPRRLAGPSKPENEILLWESLLDGNQNEEGMIDTSMNSFQDQSVTELLGKETSAATEEMGRPLVEEGLGSWMDLVVDFDLWDLLK